MSDPKWYAIHSKPRKEAQVYGYLISKNAEVFYPTIRVKPVNPRAAKVRPYFPGYLFVRADLEETGTSALEWVPGAAGLVSFGGEPAVVPERFIHELQRRLAEMKVIQESGSSRFKPGEQVLIVGGAFRGYDAIFDTKLNGDQRVQVLLSWLGRQMKVEVDADLIERRKQP